MSQLIVSCCCDHYTGPYIPPLAVSVLYRPAPSTDRTVCISLLQEYLDLGLPSPPDSGDSSHDVSVDSQFELCKSTAM